MRWRARTVDVAALPRTSVAEFRRAAWPVIDDHLAGAVTMQLYLTWGALGGAAALLLFGLAGLAVDPRSWWIVGVGLVVAALVVRRLRRKFTGARRVREEVDAASRDLDARAARGLVPLAPEGWTDGILPPPHERRSSWM